MRWICMRPTASMIAAMMFGATVPVHAGDTPVTKREIVPSSALGLYAKAFTSPRGFDIFWDSQPALGDPHFSLVHAAFSASGEPLDQPAMILDQYVRWIAPGDSREFGTIYMSGLHAHVAVVRSDANTVLWDVALPSESFTHGNLAIGWDPKHAQWVVVGEDGFVTPDRSTIVNQLFTARLDRRGAWVQKPTRISPRSANASMSDWSNPLIWTGDRMAVVWAGNVDHAWTLYLTELDPDRATDHVVAHGERSFLRTVLAWTNSGYVISGAEYDQLRDSRVFVTTVRDGVAAPLRYVSTSGAYGGEVAMATDGTRVALAWNEQPADEIGERTTVRAAVIDEHGDVSNAFASDTPNGRHDWVQSVAWNGSRFTLLHTRGINPAAIELVGFSNHPTVRAKSTTKLAR